MAGETAIEWADATWNPIVGCEITSPGCKHCYAMPQAARIERMAAGAGRGTHYAGTTELSKAGPVWTGKVAMAPAEAVAAPLHWRRPRRIFVNSMGDLFAPAVTDAMRDRVWAVMACAPRHTFIVLTKRAAAMRAYATDLLDPGLLRWVETPVDHPAGRRPLIGRVEVGALTSPLPNVWLGVTTEDQPRADERIPELLRTPAAKRIVSVEPMIGPVNLATIDLDGWSEIHPLSGDRDYLDEDGRPGKEWPALDWVIVGGESGVGPGIRPMAPSWPRQVREDCAAAGVPFFFKQWGEWAPGISAPSGTAGHFAFGDYEHDQPCRSLTVVDQAPRQLAMFGARARMTRVGKRAAGGELDGVVHHAWPEAST